MKRNAYTASGAVAVGPYSHAIDADGFFFLSGQTPLDPATGKLVEGGIQEQAQQCFVNLFSVLEACGLTHDDVQKVNVYLTDMTTFPQMNEVYARQFSQPYPARTTIGVAALPLEAQIEVELIAKKTQK